VNQAVISRGRPRLAQGLFAAALFLLLQRHQPPTCVAARTGSRTARPIQGQFSVPVAPENSPVSHFYSRKNFENLVD
jgi:hypothetical protein